MKMNQYLHHNSFHAALTSPLKENECKQTAYSCCDPHIRLSGVLVHGVSSKYKHYDFVSQASILKKFCQQSVFLFFSFFLCFFFNLHRKHHSQMSGFGCQFSESKSGGFVPDSLFRSSVQQSYREENLSRNAAPRPRCILSKERDWLGELLLRRHHYQSF